MSEFFLTPSVLPLSRCGQSHETHVGGMFWGAQKLPFPSNTPRTPPHFVPGTGEEQACGAWCGAKENTVGFGKACKQSAIPGAARALGHAEEGLQ